MANITLYIRDKDKKTIEECKRILEDDGRTLSQFFVRAAAIYVRSKNGSENEITRASGNRS